MAKKTAKTDQTDPDVAENAKDELTALEAISALEASLSMTLAEILVRVVKNEADIRTLKGE